MARRAEASPSLAAISFAALLLSLISGGSVGLVRAQKTWCIAKPSLDHAALWENLNYACSQVDCGIMKEGHPCFKPDTVASHASLAMNLYYQAAGRNSWNCYFNDSGLVVHEDPSFGNCTYA